MMGRMRVSPQTSRAYCFALLLGVLWHSLVSWGLQVKIWEEPFGLIAGAVAGSAAGAFCLATQQLRSLSQRVALTGPTLAIGVLVYWVVGHVAYHVFGEPGSAESLLESLLEIRILIVGVAMMSCIWLPLTWGTRHVFLRYVRSAWCAR